MAQKKYPYTNATNKAIEIAKEYCARSGQGALGTEHILLGLAKTPCVVSELLEKFGVTADKIEALIEELVESPKKKPTAALIEWTPKAKKVFDIATEEMLRGHMLKVGTEHVMVALMCQEDSAALRILRSLDFEDDKFIVEMFQMMGEDGLIYLDDFQNASQILDSIDTNALASYSTDLTELARMGKLDPVVGREDEMNRLIRTLSRRMKNNPCLIGEPGVGKTAIVEKLAQEISDGNVPETLKGKKVLCLDLAALVAGTKFRGEFEERLENVIREASFAGNILLFLDEIHTIIGTGSAEGSLDAANILKPALSRGRLQVIGATTIDEYRKRIEKDAALERRFQPLEIKEPSEEESIQILKGIREAYEGHHKLTITDDAIEAAVTLSARYVSDRFLPDKAIDVMDEAAAKKSIRYKRKKDIVVEASDIATVISELTKIPVSKLTESESKKLMKLESVLHKSIIGQEDAVSAIARAVRRGRVGLKDPSRPIGSFLFLGPTGVGKTELARVLAETLFGRKESMIRVDMSEYMEQHSVSKMIGSPPGYVGFDEGGGLTEKVRRNPYSVLLFDEIEKAHPDIYHVLLQILDDGHITDAKGRVVDFKNTIIIMTSNAGAERIVDPKKLGFASEQSAEEDYKKMKDGVMEEVKKLFRPELLNRIDEIQVFRQLNRDEVSRILALQIRELNDRISGSLGITISLAASASDYLMDKGFDERYGARPLRRAIQTELEDEIALLMLDGKIKAGDDVEASYSKKAGKITFKKALAKKL